MIMEKNTESSNTTHIHNLHRTSITVYRHHRNNNRFNLGVQPPLNRTQARCYLNNIEVCLIWNVRAWRGDRCAIRIHSHTVPNKARYNTLKPI